MRLFLVRHGRTASNVAGLLDTAYPGAPLDAVGAAQADALARRFEGLDLDAIYSSDIRRAVQTATPLAAARRVMVRPLPGLREIPAGDQELSPRWGPYIDVLKAWGEGRPDARRPGGEDCDTFFARFDAAVAAIADAHAGSVVAVSHGAALRTWLSVRVEGLDADGIAARRLGNTAVVALEGRPEHWHLADWHDGVHDDTPYRVPERRGSTDLSSD